MKYTPSKKMVIIATVSAIGIFLVCAFFLHFIFSRVGNLRQASLKNKEYALNTDKVFNIKKELNNTAKQTEVLEGFFLHPGEEVFFLEKIEASAKLFKVKVETQNISEGKNLERGFVPLQLSVNYEGKLEDIVSFLKRIESLPYAVKLSSVNMHSLSQDVWSGTGNLIVYKTAK